MEFTPEGVLVQAWGGPGEGYEWPADEHGIHVDHNDNVWVSSAGGPRMRDRTENHLLKFTRDGQFLLQIGRRGASEGSLDTDNLNNAADMYVYAPTNELFVADGYVNRRVAVFDATTGAFKRMWGAYGDPPDDEAPNTPQYEGEPARQFNTVHGIRVSGRRLGVRRRPAEQPLCRCSGSTGPSSANSSSSADTPAGNGFSVAFSPDADQEHLYVADAGNGRVRIYDRSTLQELTNFGRIGRYAGQFIFLHNVAVDSEGNVYTAEVGGGRRVQKFLRD